MQKVNNVILFAQPLTEFEKSVPYLKIYEPSTQTSQEIHIGSLIHIKEHDGKVGE